MVTTNRGHNVKDHLIQLIDRSQLGHSPTLIMMKSKL